MQKRDKYLIVASALVISGVLFFLSAGFFHKKVVGAKATSATFPLTTESQWNAGNLTNIDSATSPGSIKLLDKGTSSLILAGKTISADYDAGDQANLIDGNTATRWGSNSATPTDYYWQIDLASSQSISEIKVYAVQSDWWYKVQYSLNGTDFSDYSSFFNHFGLDSWDTYSVTATVQYIRIVCSRHTTGEMAPPGVIIGEIEIYGAASATHTTAPTQIDGGVNFWQWESFADTKTVPANTSVTYRYRTSSDSTTWTAWVGDIGSVTSRVGDTKYRYLQVEATLSNTDGASTPTIDSYDIGYHTEQKPNKPSAQTAVTQ